MFGDGVGQDNTGNWTGGWQCEGGTGQGKALGGSRCREECRGKKVR